VSLPRRIYVDTRRFAALSAAVAGATLAAPLKARASATRSGWSLACRFLWSATGSGPLILPATLRLIHSVGYATIETYPLVYNRPAKD